MSEEKTVKTLSVVGIAGNVALFAFKLLAGIIGHSAAMISDAVHSLSDVLATFIALAGVKLAGKKEDSDHPYGHERFECVASLLLGFILAFTGAAIGYKGLQSLVTGAWSTSPVPTALPLAAAVVSILVKEAMFRYTMHHAKRIGSSAFESDAWHHRSDALSSIGSLIGIAGARLGLPFMDALASVIIAVFILKVAFDIVRDSLDRMVDRACDSETEGRIREVILSEDGVTGLDLLQTRQFGSKAYVDVEVSADRNSSLIEAHEIAERVHHDVEERFPAVKHVTVHVNPDMEDA